IDPFTFCCLAMNRIRRFEIEICVKQTLQSPNPRLVFTVVESECQYAARLQNAFGLAPTICEDALVEGVRIVRLTGPIGNRFQRFRHIFSGEMCGVSLSKQAGAKRRRNLKARNSEEVHRMADQSPRHPQNLPSGWTSLMRSRTRARLGS